jgi:hypothetical protein
MNAHGTSTWSKLTSVRDFAAALVVLAIGVIVFFWSRTYPRDLGIVPMLVAGATVVLAALDVVAQTHSRAGSEVRRLTGQAGDEPSTETTEAGWRAPLAAMAWPFGYLAVVIAAGFIAATPVYVFLYMWLHGRKPVTASAVAAVLVTLALWLVFEVLFRYPLYPGWLFSGR